MTSCSSIRSTSRSIMTRSTPRTPSNGDRAARAATRSTKDHHHLGWNNANPARAAGGAGRTRRVRDRRFPPAGSSRRQSTVAESQARFRQGQSGLRPGLYRRRRAGRRGQGDALGFTPSGWGWTANIPGFGLLADQFKEPALHIWKYDAADAWRPAAYGPGGRVPLKPFCGTIGLAPAEPGLHSIVPPRRVGGNMDIRDMSAGTELYLPVEVRGRPVLGRRYPCRPRATARSAAPPSKARWPSPLQVRSGEGRQSRLPALHTPGPVTRHFDAKGYEVTTGIGPDLMEAARDAVLGMIDLLSQAHGMGRSMPICCAASAPICGSARSSIMPNWVVSFYFPRVVFE